MARTLNLGIVAHVDAGKTSLTERLLHAAGVLDEVGSVDAGSTLTDSLALERARGITIRAAVVSFEVDDVTVNLLDTPGHPDFIAEVERVLGVLDGVVLVVCAVEGVQPQTRVLMRVLRRLRIPTLVFVNKIDRGGARDDHVVADIAERLTPAVVAMGSVRGLGTRDATVTPYGPTDAGFVALLVELLAERDEALLAAYVADEAAVGYPRLLDELAAQTGRALVHPVLFGSAITGAGVDALLTAIGWLLPAHDGDESGPLSGTVFKVERGPAGERIAYVRMFSGALHVRDRPRVRGEEERVTAIEVFDRGAAMARTSVVAGQIARLRGLATVQIGDVIGVPAHASTDGGQHFAPPTLETVVVPVRPADRSRLHTALGQLAEQDPLIAVRQDEAGGEIAVSLYGEVQKEVLEHALAVDFGIAVDFRSTAPLCIERLEGTGGAVERLGQPPNPFLATLGLTLEPGPAGSGLEVRLAVEVGAIPLYVYRTVDAFRDAMTEHVRATLAQGLCGWRVEDCVVTMTDCGYTSPATASVDFRRLAPLVVMAALKRAGTVVCEPVHRFTLEIPADAHGAVLPVLTQLRARPHPPAADGTIYLVAGTIPAARVHELQRRLPTLTRGEGVLEFEFSHYRPITGPAPTRPRAEPDPLDRDAYLLRVRRRA